MRSPSLPLTLNLMGETTVILTARLVVNRGGVEPWEAKLRGQEGDT